MSKHEVISMEKCPVCKRSFVYNRMSIYKIKNKSVNMKPKDAALNRNQVCITGC